MLLQTLIASYRGLMTATPHAQSGGGEYDTDPALHSPQIENKKYAVEIGCNEHLL